jgi:hypothetical protein
MITKHLNFLWMKVKEITITDEETKKSWQTP